MRMFIAVLLLFVGFAAGFYSGQTAAQEDKPYCPAEDSCTIDYRNGEWHIEEDAG